jgi:hypothetical protein
MCRWSLTQLRAGREKRGGGGGGEAAKAKWPTRLPFALHRPHASTAIQDQPSDNYHALRHRRCSLTHLPCSLNHHPPCRLRTPRGRPPPKSSCAPTAIATRFSRLAWRKGRRGGELRPKRPPTLPLMPHSPSHCL